MGKSQVAVDKLRFKSITKKEAYALKEGQFVLVQYTDVKELEWGMLTSRFERVGVGNAYFTLWLTSRFDRAKGDSMADVFMQPVFIGHKIDRNFRMFQNICHEQVVAYSTMPALTMWENSKKSNLVEYGVVKFSDVTREFDEAFRKTFMKNR